MRSQTGFGLVEVMVSAVVVVLIATATVSSIGASQKQSGRTLARGVTANLANQDQERMKSMRTADLIDYSSTRLVRQENANYTVESESHLIQGPGGQRITCSSTGQQSQFLQLTSTVTPPPATDGDPQTIVSLEPLPLTQYSPTSGTLIVKLVRADGVSPQAGIPVTLAGPDARSATTNSQGCAIFQFLTPGSYVATINSPGYVEETLSQRRDMSVTVSPGQISSTPIQLYDRAGSISPVRFNGAATGTASGITISNGAVPNPSTRTFAGATAGGLFPFAASPYKVWAGRCALNNPEVWQPTFYTTPANIAAGYGPVSVTAGAGVGANVREPIITINLRFTRASGQTTTAPQLYVRQMDTGCNTSTHFYDQTTGTPFTLPAGTTAQNNVSLGAVSRGYPFGRYWICASVAKNGGSSTNGTYSTATTQTGFVANTTFNGPAAAPTLTINTTTGTPTTCDARWASITALAAP